MKKIILVFLFLFSTSISISAQNFEVNIDTLHLNLKEICRPASRVRLTHAVKYDNKFYCFFEERGIYSFKVETKYFLELSENSKVLNILETPEEIQEANYFDFFIRNDSLFTKTYMDNSSFFFDKEKLKWKKIKDVDDQVFEDEKYKVCYLDFGEFGESTWFIDKKTKKEYVIGTNGRTINFLNSRYILTNKGEIREILNPQNLWECKPDEYYNIVKTENNLQDISYSLIGSEEIYKDSSYNSLSFKKPIQEVHNSFVIDKELYHLYSDNISTYIGQSKNGKLIETQNLNKRYSFLNSNHSYRGNNIENDYRLLKFKENKDTFGLIQIKGHSIDVRYFKHNIDSLMYLGTDNFEKLLSFLKSNYDKLNIQQLENIENEIGGINMKTDRTNTSHNGYYPQKFSSIQIKTKEFIKVESDIIAQNTEYVYTSTDKKVKSIFIKWLPTELTKEPEILDFLNEDKKEKSIAFSKKQNELITTIAKVLNSTPIIKKSRDNNFDIVWKIQNGLEVKLYGRENFERKFEIRMIINLNN